MSDLNKLKLTIDELNDVSWFRQKYWKFQERIGIKVYLKQERNRGIKVQH